MRSSHLLFTSFLIPKEPHWCSRLSSALASLSQSRIIALIIWLFLPFGRTFARQLGEFHPRSIVIISHAALSLLHSMFALFPLYISSLYASSTRGNERKIYSFSSFSLYIPISLGMYKYIGNGTKSVVLFANGDREPRQLFGITLKVDYCAKNWDLYRVYMLVIYTYEAS